MPKLKTNRAAAKRFSRTGGGRFRRSHAYHNHILTKKDSKRKRGLRKQTTVAERDAGIVRRLLPYQ